jgi:DNA-binding XRE family transcriptional regulator
MYKNNGVAKKIKDLRKEFNFSQTKLAKLLWINRVTLSLIESWEKKLKEEDIKKLSEIFEEDINIFRNKTELLNKIDKLYDFKKILLYVLNKVKDKKNVWKTVLYKLLYFIEFNHYEKFGKSLLWIEFIKWPKWPVVLNAHKIFNEMRDKWQIIEIITKYKTFPQYKLVSNIKNINLTDLKPEQIKIIDDVIKKLWDMTATQISKYSHEDMPYKATREIGDIISKGLVFYRSSAYSITED